MQSLNYSSNYHVSLLTAMQSDTLSIDLMDRLLQCIISCVFLCVFCVFSCIVLCLFLCVCYHPLANKTFAF